uniref:Uncharacterized protein n=1 Tax=Panagrolaimus sp. ES5 TaxID=591445 RepID=A0AC34G8Z3_9BILA
MSGAIRTTLRHIYATIQRHCKEYEEAIKEYPIPWDLVGMAKFSGILSKLQKDASNLEDEWEKWNIMVDCFQTENVIQAELDLFNEWRDKIEYMDADDDLIGYMAEIKFYLTVESGLDKERSIAELTVEPSSVTQQLSQKPDPTVSPCDLPKVQPCEPYQPETKTPEVEPAHAKKYLPFLPGFNMEAVFEEDICGRKNLQVDSSSVPKIDGPASRRRVILQAARGEDIVERYFFQALYGPVHLYSILGNSVIDVGHPNGDGAAVFDPGIIQKYYCIRETQSVDGVVKEGAVNLDISAEKQ